MKLTKQAQSALLAARGSREGTAIDRTTAGTALELRAAGMITSNGNLTRKGSIERERATTRLENEAFGR